ncbi:MAG: Arm DNA-binding domain-containing protein [Desulfovibrionaceae bacterium]
MALTTSQIQSAIPREKTYRLRDSRCLCLEVSPRGGKWWRFRYTFRGRDNFISLGVFPTVSLGEAREKGCKTPRRSADMSRSARPQATA